MFSEALFCGIGADDVAGGCARDPVELSEAVRNFTLRPQGGVFAMRVGHEIAQSLHSFGMTSPAPPFLPSCFPDSKRPIHRVKLENRKSGTTAQHFFTRSQSMEGRRLAERPPAGERKLPTDHADCTNRTPPRESAVLPALCKPSCLKWGCSSAMIGAGMCNEVPF